MIFFQRFASKGRKTDSDNKLLHLYEVWNIYKKLRSIRLNPEPSSALTQHGGAQRGLDERQRGVVRLMENVDLLALQLVLGQDVLQALQHPDPLLFLRLALRQHQQGHRGELRGQLGRRHLRQRQTRRSVWEVREELEEAEGFPTLKMQGMSFLVAWMTSEANTELTDKSSSLKHKYCSVQTSAIFLDQVWGNNLKVVGHFKRLVFTPTTCCNFKHGFQANKSVKEKIPRRFDQGLSTTEA